MKATHSYFWDEAQEERKTSLQKRFSGEVCPRQRTHGIVAPRYEGPHVPAQSTRWTHSSAEYPAVAAQPVCGGPAVRLLELSRTGRPLPTTARHSGGNGTRPTCGTRCTVPLWPQHSAAGVLPGQPSATGAPAPPRRLRGAFELSCICSDLEFGSRASKMARRTACPGPAPAARDGLLGAPTRVCRLQWCHDAA